MNMADEIQRLKEIEELARELWEADNQEEGASWEAPPSKLVIGDRTNAGVTEDTRNEYRERARQMLAEADNALLAGSDDSVSED